MRPHVPACVLGWSLFAAGSLFAHDPFELTTQAQVHGGTIELTVTMSRSTALQVAGQATVPGELFAPEQFPALQPSFLAAAPRLYDLQAGPAHLAPEQATVQLSSESDVEFRLTYARPAAATLKMAATHLERLAEGGYGDVLTVFGEDRKLLAMKLLVPEDAVLEVPLGPALGSAPAVSAATTRSTPAAAVVTPSFREFFLLGLRHIFGGYDHLLFLAGLLVGCHRFRTVAAIVTCFTLAHALTLTLGAFSLIVIAPNLAEPLIAATIVLVGLENLWQSGEPRGRWKTSFGFGLIHGFGFAGVLRQLGLGRPGASLALPLFSFNLGVELSQILVAMLVLPLFWQVQKTPVAARWLRLLVSSTVAVLGIWWLLERTLL